MYYKLVKVMINELDLTKVIFHIVIRDYNILDSIINKLKLGFYLEILIIFMPLF